MKIKNTECSGITDDSRKVAKGDCFFAVQGASFDGRKFIDEAVKKGAAAVVKCSRQDLAKFACEFYGNPSSRVKVIGITGTNGKTTISYLLSAIFKKAGYESGIIGTIAHRWKDNLIEAKNTTPGAIELQRILSEMVKDGVRYCAMEVSSHSLDQDRVLGIDFKTAIFTNITGEHLDYHKTFGNYFKAKARLFKNLKENGTAVLNADEPSFNIMKRNTRARIITYGIKNEADIRADGIKFGLEGTEFLIRIKKDKKGIIRTLLAGDFNVYNILAAICAALNEGITIETIKEVVSEFKGAEGRLEPVESGTGFKIFIDYAHTDNALENVLKTLNRIPKNRLIVVFGCGGDRDRFKRPRMGRVASQLSDYVIITSDNPRSESPLAIAGQIEKGLDKNFSSYEIMLDRIEAIKRAVAIAMAGDIILIAGKGHERYQQIGDKRLPFSDREAVLKILNSKSKIQNKSEILNSNVPN